MMVISLTLLVSATYFNLPAWVATLGGMTPLIWYHLGVLGPRARLGLSQAAIDSVYYFGFLVTIAALGVSAMSLALRPGADSIGTIGYQFGLGLFATGYAVFARMHLTSISTWMDEQSPEVLLDRYLKRTQELVTNVELASVQFETLATNLMVRTERVTANAVETTEKSLLELARHFDEQLRQTLASGNEGLAQLRTLISETSFREERLALAQSIKVTLDYVTQLNKALQDLTARSAESAQSTLVSQQRTTELATSVAKFASAIEAIAGAGGTLMRTASTFEATQNKATDATEALDAVVRELVEIGGSLGAGDSVLKNLKALSTRASTHLEALATSTEHLARATEHVGLSAQKTDALAAGVERVTFALPQLDEKVVALGEHLDGLREAAAGAQEQLKSLPPATEAAVALTNTLASAVEQLHALLAKAGGQAQLLVGSTESTMQALEQAKLLAGGVGNLQDTTKAVNDLLAALVANAEMATVSLSTSAQEMQRTVSTASAALQSDVQTSAKAATLFTTSLAQVAQGIIDETKRAGAA